MKAVSLTQARLSFVRNGDGEIWKADPESGTVLSSFQGPANNAAGDRAGSLPLVYSTVESKRG